MARGVNKVIAIGNLGKDPDVKSFPNGGQVANVSLAVSEQWKDKSGQQQEHTEWLNLVFNDKSAEIAGKYLRKGSKVYVEGKIRTRKYQDKEGKERFITEIRVSDFQMLDGKPADEREERSSPQHERASSVAAHDDIDDSIPF